MKPLTHLVERHPLIRFNPVVVAANDASNQATSNHNEAAIMAALVGQQAKRLHHDWKQLLVRLSRLGATLFITRHGKTSHEKLLRLYKIALSGNTASIVDQDGSLELDLSHWHCAFALHDQCEPDKACVSFHFFDIHGKLLHSIYPTLSCKELGSEWLLPLYAVDQTPETFLLPPSLPHKRRISASTDVCSLVAHWRHLQSCHAIPVILQKHQLTRWQAIQLLPREYAQPARPDAIRQVLEQARAQQLEVQLSLHNPGIIQTHVGIPDLTRPDAVCNRSQDAWFRLHLDDSDQHSTWIVHKPTQMGMVSSLESYDCNGELLLMLSAKPPANLPQTLQWQQLLQDFAAKTA